RRPPDLVEGVDQIGAVNRNAERDVPQPDGSADEELLVAEEGLERQHTAPAEREQADDGQHAQDDRRPEDRAQPLSLVLGRASLRTHASASASASASCRSTRMPSRPLWTISRVPADDVATTGTPHAIASTSTLPNPS